MTSTIPEIAHLQIPLQEILVATNYFSDTKIIGKGGFGNVYGGKRKHYSGETIKIAARRLDRRYGLGDVEFWKEVSALSSLRERKYIVNMIGFCDEKDEKIIINQHYPKGSLQMHISDPAFTWEKRSDLANRLLLGIYTIHNELGSEYIIHRNINSSTILVDDYWHPRISGFEFSIKKPVEQRKRVIFSEVVGTKGYIDPAIEKYGGVTEKSDIYALGIVLLELLCGRKAFEENMLLAQLAKFHYENGTLRDIIHPDLWNQTDPQELEFYSELAYSCLQEEPTLRPDANQLLEQFTAARSFKKKKEQFHMLEKEGRSKNSKDETQMPRDMLDKSSSEDWKDLKKYLLQKYYHDAPEKVEKLEHLRIELTDIYDSPPTPHSRQYSPAIFTSKSGRSFNKKEIEFYDREDVSLVEKKNNDKLPKRCRTVAVRTGWESNKTLFLPQIEILGSCKHPNIQSFLGFSYQDGTMKLFYEYVSFKYLDEFLKDGTLTWEKRLKICIDVAHGLDYLDNGMEDQKMVIHGGINSCNIELDDIFRAKIVNFENSVLLSSNQRDMTGKVKAESDVSSFGVISNYA